MRVAYLVSTKKPGLKFKIVGVKKQDGGALMTLEGSHGVKFERTITEEILQKYGYRVEQVEE